MLLAPNGKGQQMRATSNGQGRIYVCATETKLPVEKIEMLGNGDADGLIWVYYDASGAPGVVRDQGSFHGGAHPALGRPLDC